jgi:hypothetical protein
MCPENIDIFMTLGVSSGNANEIKRQLTHGDRAELLVPKDKLKKEVLASNYKFHTFNVSVSEEPNQDGDVVLVIERMKTS